MTDDDDRSALARRIERLTEHSPPEEVAAACAGALRAVPGLASPLVEALGRVAPHNRFIVAEPLARLGPLPRPDLERLFASTDDADLRLLTALLLLPLGDAAAEAWLLQVARAARSDPGAAIAALRALSRAGRRDVGGLAWAILRDERIATLQWPEVTALLGVVERSGDAVSAAEVDAVRRRYGGTIVDAALRRLRRP